MLYYIEFAAEVVEDVSCIGLVIVDWIDGPTFDTELNHLFFICLSIAGSPFFD